jgi:hypothetical protein
MKDERALPCAHDDDYDDVTCDCREIEAPRHPFDNHMQGQQSRKTGSWRHVRGMTSLSIMT